MHQLADFMIALLVAAAVVSGLLGDIVDTIVIVVIVVLNAAVGVSQEYRAQRSVAALREMSAPLARVRRDGSVQEIAARDVVPGDIVLLEAGDVVPSDLQLLLTTDLGIDESALTGESVPVAKDAAAVTGTAQASGERGNMAFRSTLVTRGRGEGVTLATGHGTEIGKIADLLKSAGRQRTPLQTRLAKFSQRIALAVLAVCAIVFATGLMQGQPLLLMFLTALSLAVAAVPEALPAVITVALGLGARRLGDLNALVRRLPAVESLGSVTYICADKTGTLTDNRMSLGVIVADNQRYERLADIVPGQLAEQIGNVLALCNDVTTIAGEVKGEPTEIALMEGARDAGYEKSTLEIQMPRIDELPFEAARRYMVTRHQADSTQLTLIKGAPERVLETCAEQLTANGRVFAVMLVAVAAGALAAGALPGAMRMTSSGPSPREQS